MNEYAVGPVLAGLFVLVLFGYLAYGVFKKDKSPKYVERPPVVEDEEVEDEDEEDKDIEDEADEVAKERVKRAIRRHGRQSNKESD